MDTMTPDQLATHWRLKGQPLMPAWRARAKLRAEGNKLQAEGNKLQAEGNKLRAEGDKLWAEGNKLYAEGDKLYAEGDKLYAEGGKLRAEGNKLWAEAVIAEYGPRATVEWTAEGCTISGSEVYLDEEDNP